jgi:multidrug transporter EmrE-like cation transporter
MNTFAIALLSVALSVAAQFALKAGMSDQGVRDAMAQPYSMGNIASVIVNKYVLGGFLLYGMGAVIWLGVLSKWDVSKAYPLVGLGFALTVVVGLIAGEHVSPLRAGGVALICAGVFLVARS